VEFLDGVFGKLHNNLETEGSTSSKFGSPSTHPPILPTKFHVPPLELPPITIKLSSSALNSQLSLITDFSTTANGSAYVLGKLNDDHWYLYMTEASLQEPQTQKPAPDKTLEVSALCASQFD
jgi:hypothetical protein